MRFDKWLLLPVGFTYALLTTRIIITGEWTYIFLGWNLFLAWIPFAISQQLVKVKNSFLVFFLIAAWLLFLPNAPYIITDFFHLKQRVPVPYWYDVLLLFSAALNGLLLGFASLMKTENYLHKKFGARRSAFIIVSSLFLCAFGIYIGRWLRWNSWDVLMNPVQLIDDITERVLNPLDHFFTWSVTALFGSFLVIMYYTIKNFIHQQKNQF